VLAFHPPLASRTCFDKWIGPLTEDRFLAGEKMPTSLVFPLLRVLYLFSLLYLRAGKIS